MDAQNASLVIICAVEVMTVYACVAWHLCYFVLLCEAMCEASGDLVRRFGSDAAILRVRSAREH